MKNVLTRILLLFALVILGACGGENKPNPNPDGNGAVANPAQFSAFATSAISVQLTWSEVTGATKYLLERKITAPAKLVDADFVPWLELGVAQTTYEDFLVPDNANVTYRVKATNASGSSTGKEASATTPVQIPNPLTVQATFDTTLSKSVLLGAAGGTLSVTGANGVIYTLTVPPDALPEDQTLTLTPFIDLTGSPLSGGTLGAVRIEPEDLLFFVPATLSIELPSPMPDDGLLTVAFAFEGSGSEFHLVPSEQPVPVAAELSPQGGFKMVTVPANKGGSKGAGRGTNSNVKNQTKTHPPTKPANQKKQQKATQQFNDDFEISPIYLEGFRIEWASAVATDWEEIIDARSDFATWLEKVLKERERLALPEFLKAREEAIAAELALSLKVRMEKDAKACEHIELIEKEISWLKKPKTPAQQSIQRAWNKQFPNALKDIQNALYQCWEWKGTAKGFLGKEGVLYFDTTVELIFRPQVNPAPSSSVVDYTAKVLRHDSSVISTGCSARISNYVVVEPIHFQVDFTNASEGRLSYTANGSSKFTPHLKCPNTPEQTLTAQSLIFMITTQSEDSPSVQKIVGKFGNEAIGGEWEFVRQPRSK
jgi:hypothetical protein